MATKLETQQDRAQALETLTRVHEALSNGGVLVVTIKHTSASNMSYRYDVRLYATSETGRVESWYLNWMFATLTGSRRHDNGEVKANGCGFDRAHDVAYTFQNLFAANGFADLGLPRYEGVY